MEVSALFGYTPADADERLRMARARAFHELTCGQPSAGALRLELAQAKFESARSELELVKLEVLGPKTPWGTHCKCDRPCKCI